MSTPMTDRIDHEAEARSWVEYSGNLCPDTYSGRAMHSIAISQVHATLALVEQQRIANLIALAGLPTISGSPVSDYADTLRDAALTALAEYRYTPPDHEEIVVLPEIARALGLEVGDE